VQVLDCCNCCTGSMGPSIVMLQKDTCCCDKHASPYWTFIRRWTSIGFTPSLIKKQITERCSSFVHVTSGAAIFKLALWWRSVCLHYTTTYRILFIALVTCLPTYRTMARYFEFLSQFYGFYLIHPRILSLSSSTHDQHHFKAKWRKIFFHTK
jgi:hypothetical protein